jgi:uncharacterized integral membrane protein (TIGR00698 family)
LKKLPALFLFLGVTFCLSPWASAPFALFLGLFIALTVGNPFADKTKIYSQKILIYSIVGLGAGMNLITVMEVGLSGFGYTLLSLIAIGGLGLILGRFLVSDRETSILITVGTAICGGSAIAAVAPVIRAKSQSVTVALATVFLLNAVALFMFPFLGGLLGLSQHQFGLWSALAIHDTSSVVGATLQYGDEALSVGTTVKLARALWIVPLTLSLSYFYRDHGSEKLKTKKPWFILGFLLVAALVTYIPELKSWGQYIEAGARKGLILALFFIGSNLTLTTLKAVGLKPLFQGLILWFIVMLATLLAVKAYA